MTSEESSEMKQKRLYREVKYARLCSLSLKRTSEVFRLMRVHKYLEAEEYSENLITYLTTARRCNTITIKDLDNVLRGLRNKNVVVEEEDNEGSMTGYAIGEHIVAFWVEGTKPNWYLGIVEENEGPGPVVSYMKRIEAEGRSWAYPETAEILEISEDQILARKVNVQYARTVRIK